MILAGALFLLWLLSLRLRDSSIIDLFWGPAFSVLFWPMAISHGLTPRSILVGSLLSLWGLRLGVYLAWRNLGHGEDKRYTAMRNKHGAAWWWRSLFIVFGLQGLLATVVALPVIASISDSSAIGVFDWVGGVVVLSGIVVEATADWQLARFRKGLLGEGISPSHPPASSPRRIMDSGLWRYSRHPNYFGNFVIWWGFGIFGVAAGAWWSIIGPIVMSVLLLKVSGKDLLEQGMKHRPGYAEYVARTPGFFPWFPKS